jgi:hypothetical protein
MSWASLISGIVSLFNWIAGLLHDKQIADGAVAKAELESRKEQDALIDTIKSAQSDDSVRVSTRKKYSRKGSTLQ